MSDDCGATMMNGPYRLLVSAKYPSANANAVLIENEVLNLVYLALACCLTEKLNRSPECDHVADAVWFTGLARLMFEKLSWKLFLLVELGL